MDRKKKQDLSNICNYNCFIHCRLGMCCMVSTRWRPKRSQVGLDVGVAQRGRGSTLSSAHIEPRPDLRSAVRAYSICMGGYAQRQERQERRSCWMLRRREGKEMEPLEFSSFDRPLQSPLNTVHIPVCFCFTTLPSSDRIRWCVTCGIHLLHEISSTWGVERCLCLSIQPTLRYCKHISSFEKDIEEKISGF